MNKLLFLSLLLLSLASYSQNDPKQQFLEGEEYLQNRNFDKAYQLFKNLEKKLNSQDTLYPYVLWYCIGATDELAKTYRGKERWQETLKYSKETLELIRKGVLYFNKDFAAREFWAIKNIIVAYFGLNQLKEARKYQDMLYQAYKEKRLPKGINQYYNFEFFKWKDKNIWGYEWYPELGDPETKGSFSKIVYYVYSTKPDGSDSEQLYRIHVLKFHKLGNDVPFDYLLTIRLEKPLQMKSGSLYNYTYKKSIDYKKLRKDIRKVLAGDYYNKKTKKD